MTSSKLRRTHAALVESLDRALRQASDPALRGVSALSVSAWSVGDHLEHLSMANERIVAWMERACAGDADLHAGGGPNLLGRIVLLVGAFPRGRGKAPDPTVPKGMDAEELVASSRRLKARVEALESSLPRLRAARATRNHFAFGDLSAAQWLRFAVIHNNHHQRIIRDILRVDAAARLAP